MEGPGRRRRRGYVLNVEEVRAGQYRTERWTLGDGGEEERLMGESVADRLMDKTGGAA